MLLQSSLGATIRAGDILVGNDGNSTVIKIDPVTGAQTLLATFTTVTTNGTQVGGVHDLALAPNGDLIVLLHVQTVSKVNILTGATTDLTSEGLLGTHAQDTFLAGLAVAPNGDIYVSVYTYPYTGIVKVNPVTGAQSSVASGGFISGPIGIGFVPSGELMVADIYRRMLYAVNPLTGFQRSVATGFPMSTPWGLTTDSGGNVYLCGGGTNAIWKVNPAGSVSTVAFGGLLDQPNDVALEPGGTLVSFQTVSNSVVRINPTNNTQTIVSQGGFISGALSLIVAGFSVPASNPPAQLGLQIYPGVSIQGAVGGLYNVQYSEAAGGSNWISLTNIILPSSPYLFVDTAITNHAQRFYRAVPFP
jgi:sugar lactone lactonase YvrE